MAVHDSQEYCDTTVTDTAEHTHDSNGVVVCHFKCVCEAAERDGELQRQVCHYLLSPCLCMLGSLLSTTDCLCEQILALYIYVAVDNVSSSCRSVVQLRAHDDTVQASLPKFPDAHHTQVHSDQTGSFSY